MHPLLENDLLLSRRNFFGSTGLRLGGVAMALLGADKLAAAKPAERMHAALPGMPHFPPRAKSLIYLHMNGGPAQMDLWDFKPGLQQYFNTDLPDSVRKGQHITTMTSGQARLPVAPSKFKFTQHGESGRWVSELLPFTAKCVDDIAVVRSVFTNAINHDPACTFVMTGSEIPGKPSLGSWLAYGLGSENNDLPAFVVLTPNWTSGAAAQALFSRMWSSGFLPSRYTGVTLRHVGDPVLYVQNPPGVSAQSRRAMLDTLAKLNQRTLDKMLDPETQTRMSQYEVAYRMQSSVPELTDLSKESKETLELYGPEVTKPGTFAASALLARRLVERGVRCVQLLHRGWDQHGNLPRDHASQCLDTDQPSYALLTDLKRRGLLDSTLVVWGGEFGRTVYSQGALTNETYGRDHHPRCFSMWLAGGGIKAGAQFGATDDFSYNITNDPVSVNDLNATILHCLGVDHEKFAVKFQGLDQRLTGVEAPKVVKALLA